MQQDFRNILFGGIDNEFLQEYSVKIPEIDFSVSDEDSKEYINHLKKKISKKDFDLLFESCKDVAIDNLLRPLKLSRTDLATTDRDFCYTRDDYTKSPKSVGGTKDGFNSIRKSLIGDKINTDGLVTDQYTGGKIPKNKTDADHINSLKNLHDSGGYILSRKEKRELGALGDNIAFTDSGINRSKGKKNLDIFSKESKKVDSRRTKPLIKHAKSSIEKTIPSSPGKKVGFIAKKSSLDGLRTGAKQGLQKAIAVLMHEIISEIFNETKDVYFNGWNNESNNKQLTSELKIRLNRIKDNILKKWKDVALAFKDGALSGFISAIFTAILNMFVRTGKNLVRVIREGSLSLYEAIKIIWNRPPGMTEEQAFHQASKVLASGLIITGGILAGESIATSLNGIGLPFADTISVVISGLITGLATLLVVFLLDKIDVFSAVSQKNHKLIMGKIEPTIKNNINKIDSIINELGLESD